MSFKLKSGNASANVAASNVETLGLVSLEPRILLDAAGFVTGAEVAAEAMVADGADLGVQAIFGGEQEPTEATPRGGPWLGEITLSDSDDTNSLTPRDGPWLGEITLSDSEDTTSLTPRDGPWLGEITLSDSDDTSSLTPRDGPWL